MTVYDKANDAERRTPGARWFGASVVSLLAVAITTGCGGGDSTNPPTPAVGGSAGMGGSTLDASIGGAGGTAGKGGGGGGGTTDAQAGGGGSSTEAGPDVLLIDATDGPLTCQNDNDCANNPNAKYCDTATGKCVACKPADPNTCLPGFYCDPATSTCVSGCDTADDCQTGLDATAVSCDPVTHKCVNCVNDTHCPLGSICKGSSCEPGCNAMHGCQTGSMCCNNQCLDTNADVNNCGSCGKVCTFTHATAQCVAGQCVFDNCEPGFGNCDGNTANGCEAPAADGGAPCACDPNEVADCYTGPTNTLNVGVCKGGLMTCNATGTAWGPCLGQTLPTPESCYTAGDDDCNGQTNESGSGCACTPNATESCYTGPPTTRNVGICVDGTWTCNAMGTAWSVCAGQVLPTPETCLTPVDDDCDGLVNESGGAGCGCVPNAIHDCYTGPPATLNVGVCKSGSQKCDALGTGYGPCENDVTPTPDICTDNLDNDCNGVVNDGVTGGATGCLCFPNAVGPCYSGPTGTQDIGVCKAGSSTCNSQGDGWANCAGEVLPSTDNCTDTLDNDCNGKANDGFGKGGTGCVCVPGAEQTCYTGPTGTLNVGTCKAGTSTCATDGKSWGPCLGQIIPDLDSCLDNVDNDCNGVVNDGNHTAPGCACVPGTIKCVNNQEYLCDAVGDWGPPGGPCNQICKAGQFSCNCNTVMQCNVGPPATWVPKVPSTVCTNTQRCDAASGTCKALTTIGTNTSTGTYLQYGVFTTSNSAFKGGYDVDGDGEYVYVNRSASYLDVYRITLLDTDGDGKMEPNQHPNNPNDTGPMEQRTLTYIKSYARTTDNAPLGTASQSELYTSTPDRVYSLGPTRNGNVTEYLFATKANTVVVQPTTAFALSQLAFGTQDGIWYGSNESYRRVYSYCPSAKSWIAEFQYPDLAGTHMDGIEVIVAPSTQVQYIYVSDMTSDFLGQYRRDGNGNWIQANLFRYSDVTGSSVEGMGFGPLYHFWITGGSTLIEIGGGDLTGYLQ